MSVPWRYLERPDLRGAVAVITGASSGVGAATARALAEAGAHVVLAVRDPGKAAGVVAGITAAVPRASLQVERVDLADLGSVRTLAGRLMTTLDRLDLLINNAAVAAVRRRLTTDGFESQIGVAHFGHFALTGLLLPTLLATPGSRVVSVTSGVAGTAPRVDLSDLQSEHGYRRYRAYAQAKSANLLFALELHRRLTAAGAGTRSLAAQPGWTRTGLGPGDSAGRAERLAITVTSRLFAHPPDVGAQPILTAALADLPGGTYVTRARFNHLKGAPETIDADRITADPAHLAGLWTESERLTGVSYAVDPTTAARRAVPGTTGGRPRSEQ